MPRLTSSRVSRRELLGMMAAGTTAIVAQEQPLLGHPKGAIIRGVLKDYAPEDLSDGTTLFHEHLSLAPDFMPRWIAQARATSGQPTAPARPSGGAAPQIPAQSDGVFFMRNIDLMTNEMQQAKTAGVACIVDAGHPDMGRDINFLRQVSLKSGLPIVAGAGFYTQPFYPTQISAWSETQIYDALLKQVETDNAGALGEIGSWDYIATDERKVFRAVGRAHMATNLSIFTHTGIPGKSALEQLDILEDAGVNPQRVAIGHLGNLVDAKVEIHKEVCKRGAFIGFDRQGGPGDAQQVPMVMALIEAGYAKNLLFSSDLSTFSQTRHGGGAGYAKTLTIFVPKLKAVGASEEVLHIIMVDNPRRFLAFVPNKSRV